MLTQDGHHLVVLNDLQGSRHHKTQAVHTLPCMVDQVPRGTVDSLELHGQGAETAVAGQPEGRVLLENLTIEMDADIRSHVFGAYLQDLKQRERLTVTQIVV